MHSIQNGNIPSALITIIIATLTLLHSKCTVCEQRNRAHLGGHFRKQFHLRLFPEISAFMVEETEHILNSERGCCSPFMHPVHFIVAQVLKLAPSCGFGDYIFVSLFKLGAWRDGF
ncbi:hypothetical protein CEXT_570151 [Caerostris extrusa]|uniref:Secreted protein n=1 Tax=Caerostris extrusa TaxID=172846 RepID=A0AAV4RPN9_CAEEX|nr:hypothetical protein CEXT_570151 [Caerostris extrusa]